MQVYNPWPCTKHHVHHINLGIIFTMQLNFFILDNVSENTYNLNIYFDQPHIWENLLRVVTTFLTRKPTLHIFMQNKTNKPMQNKNTGFYFCFHLIRQIWRKLPFNIFGNDTAVYSFSLWIELYYILLYRNVYQSRQLCMKPIHRYIISNW